MARVTATQVAELITTTRDYDLFINMANTLVTKLLGSVSGLTAQQLVDIELWLSAHFIALVEEGGGVLKEKTGTSSVEFNPLSGAKGLGLTRFGQNAITLDTSNILGDAGKQRARFTVLGPPQ